jgi:hypothetical protein
VLNIFLSVYFLLNFKKFKIGKKNKEKYFLIRKNKEEIKKTINFYLFVFKK